MESGVASMNRRMILYIVGQIVRMEGILMIMPLIVSFIYEEDTWLSFLIPILLLIALGTAVTIKRPENKVIYAKEGFIIVSLSWILLSLFGGLPFFFSGEIPSFVDCFFETVSGFTTTGSSILTNVEALSQGMLFWRSFTHWIGGMGVLVFVLAILPQSEFGSMHLMRAEVPGPKVGKLVSKLRLTARILYGIYIVLSIVETLLLCAGGMSFFDSVVHSFGTAGTGGFGIKNSSIAFYGSAYIDGVIGVFMILFGINFNLFYLILVGGIVQVLKSEELRWYLGIIAAAVLFITVDITPLYHSIGQAFRYAFFQVSSIITTTGFATADFNQWPLFSQCILVLLMFIGACAGSTGGGIKVSRVLILFKTSLKEIRFMIHPRSVSTVKLEKKTVEPSVMIATSSFIITYFIIMGSSMLLLSLDSYDFTTTTTSVIACMNNIGPGLGEVGPAGNFSGFSPFSKLILSFDMLAGRLELFPMLILFAPSTWRKQ